MQSVCMVSIKMITFCKSVNCPSSEKLLAFQANKISVRDSQKIRKHLSECEFCATEVEFYARYPQSEEPVKTSEIPFPLYQLAEALLSKKNNDFTLLKDLLTNEKDQFLLEKA